ncbi:NADH-quinone oxidoreductase subunit J [Desulfuribacillus stibiiarsenatis]|uniref:NADH-quinone oxidoreductase subunit J n=1 Tax=Desulfuribacillus stibiiarsenatis TaxID=1390249 RepID=A0A1E5L5Y6_9FIRM|nr:NADH-quinone oxidoreductase subunit J [Desulfuribacillus stibiiarsenatis]OEH85448.1 NADH-quinone oxidoreductase subunit J [Desulfuribacillus stibiiarsenatis]
MTITGEVIIFFILAIIAIACAVLVITLERMAHMILSMVFTFLSIAGLYFLLRAEFIGVVQIIVYVGAMAILFVFGMMMTEHRVVAFTDEEPSKGHKSLSFIGVAALLGLILYGLSQFQLPTQAPQYVGSAHDIGLSLYGNYVIAFEAAAILLLVALVGAIVLARKEAE